MSDEPAVVGQLGDRAVLLTLRGDRERCNRRIARIAEMLRSTPNGEPTGRLLDVVPAMVSLAVFYDPVVASPAELERRLLALAAQVRDDAEPTGRVHVVPVIYDGPDLESASALLRLEPAELIRRHSGREYRVRFLGFAPGFGYLGPLDPRLTLPRLASPRHKVPAGSVAIAGDQTAVYPLETPGGWHLLGRTEIRLFDPSRSPASLFAAGDQVRFEPVAT
jgi:KipI family sensor histidine kinase inhibitor